MKKNLILEMLVKLCGVYSRRENIHTVCYCKWRRSDDVLLSMTDGMLTEMFHS